MMMRMLERGGMPVMTDGVRSADDDNPLGYYEFEGVKRLDKDTSWLPDAFGKAIKVIYVFLYCLPVDYNKLLSDPAGTVLEIDRFLGLQLKTDAMIKAVDPTLHRQRSDRLPK